KYTRRVRPLVPRSPEEDEEQLAPYAWGPDDLEAALAGLSREELDQARGAMDNHLPGAWTQCVRFAREPRGGHARGHAQRAPAAHLHRAALCWLQVEESRGARGKHRRASSARLHLRPHWLEERHLSQLDGRADLPDEAVCMCREVEMVAWACIV
ncbi:MAG TPA: hypothetical protein VKF37_01720, partial [Chloroflexota bacterium]|nr:hypothetical protein [Chloroflexota bacterium]